MRQVRIVVNRRPRKRLPDPLPLDPRDQDIVRAKRLTRPRVT